MRRAVEDADRVEAGFGTRFVRVEPDAARDRYRDMEAFISTIRGARLREHLWRAIERRGTFRRYRDALADHPRARERWFAFRDSRVRQRLFAWLASEGVEPILG